LIGVVMGGMTSAERYQLMMNMMDGGFSNRYGDGSYRNIDTLTTSMGGEPPYQLGCGNRQGITVASGNDNSRQVSYHRPAAKHYRAHQRTRAASGYHRLAAGKTKTGKKAISKRSAKRGVTVAKSKRGGVTRVAKKTAGTKSKTVKSSVARKTVKKRNKSA